jgi:hypothetical protein
MTERRFRNWLPPKRLTPSAAPAGGTEQHLETFMADVLALAGAEPDAIGEGVRVALAKAEAGFRASKSKKRMKDAAGRACRAVCRARVAESAAEERTTWSTWHWCSSAWTGVELARARLGRSRSTTMRASS